MSIFDLDKFKEIVQTLSRNRSRSLLTAFGVFWGIFMLIILIGGGNGLSTMMSKQIGGFAPNSALLIPDKTSLPYLGFPKGRYWNFAIEDIEILKRNLPNIDLIAPILARWGVKAVKEEKAGSFPIKGTSPSYVQIQGLIILQGRYINDIDVFEQRKVCVIGERVYQKLFANGEAPLGTYIRVGGIYYQVVGVVKPINESLSIGGNENEMITLPFTTMQQTFRIGNRVQLIAFTSKNNIRIAEISESAEKIIKKTHKISPDDKKGLMIMNIEEQFLLISNLFKGINILIWIVGLGTLLAGIIGVSNIMMVTVKERTQEIGVRRALGAKPMQIISQILTETILLTGISGLVGVVFGVLILQLIDMGISGGGGQSSGFQIEFWIAVATTSILLFLSILAGLAPAFRALKIKAIDALREE